MSEPVLKTLGRYEIQDEIGRGMMGVVYRANDPALGRAVALKTVQLAFSIPGEERELFEKRFLAEARAAAGLQHPGIVVVHDVGRDADTGTLFIALEYLEGRTLAALTAGGKPVEWRESLRLAARIAEALYHAHQRGIVHRDIKPANIMVLPSGAPKIMDFGIAKVPTSQLTSAGEFFGTPAYMSPEQAAGEAVDARSDLFSLGSVLYQMLVGRRAFDATNVPALLTRVSAYDPAPPSRLVPGLPEPVDYLVGRLLAKDRADRFPDAKSLAEDVEDILAGRAPRHREGWLEPLRDGTMVAAPLDGAQGQASPILRFSDRLGQLGLFALGSLAAIGLAMALILPRAEKPGPRAEKPGALRLPSLPGLEEKAHLELDCGHSFKKGTLRVWVDDDLVLERPLRAAVAKKILGLSIRKGRVHETLDVRPGDHVVRVQVEGDGYNDSRRIRGGFESGATRRLAAEVGGLAGGLIKKELSLVWGEPTPSSPGAGSSGPS